jgi:signal transduction histidine kinase
MHMQDGQLELEVADDGVGGAAFGDRGTGLSGLADRLAALGGQFTLSSAPGQGTTIPGVIPIR